MLVALGVKKTTGQVDEPLETVAAVALFGGIVLYHGAHVGFRLRTVGTVNVQRLLTALAALALVPLGREVDALVALGLAAALASAVIAYEAVRFRESRRRIRAEHA